MRILHNAKPIDIEWLKKKFFLECRLCVYSWVVVLTNWMVSTKWCVLGRIPNWCRLFSTKSLILVIIFHNVLSQKFTILATDVRLYRTGVINNI